MIDRLVVCPYCEKDAVLTDSKEIYKRSYGLIWICRPCKAWVGVHSGSPDHQPLGRLADAELRRWKMRAHESFDVLWKSKEMKRRKAYKWLAGKLRLPAAQCHIGLFDVDMCKKVVEVSASYFVSIKEK